MTHDHDPDHDLATIRRQLAQHRSRSGKRSYPPTAKHSAAQLARARQRMGHSIASTARALELHPVVLGSWLRSINERGADPFVPVVVHDATHAPSSAPVVLVHPASGVRVEGLSIAQIAELLRGLR